MSSEKLPPLYGKTERPGHGRPQRYVTPSTWEICTLIGSVQTDVENLHQVVKDFRKETDERFAAIELLLKNAEAETCICAKAVPPDLGTCYTPKTG